MHLIPQQLFSAISRVDARSFPEPVVGNGRPNHMTLARALGTPPNSPSLVSIIGNGFQIGKHWTEIVKQWRDTIFRDIDDIIWEKQQPELKRLVAEFHRHNEEQPIEVCAHLECWMDPCLANIFSGEVKVVEQIPPLPLPFAAPARLQFSTRKRSTDVTFQPDNFVWSCPDGVFPRHGLNKLIETSSVFLGNRISSGRYREQIGAGPISNEFAPWHRVGIQPVLAGKTYRASPLQNGHLSVEVSSPDQRSPLWAGILNVYLLRLIRFVPEQVLPGERQLINEELAIALCRSGRLVSATTSRYRFGHISDEGWLEKTPLGRWLRSRV